MEPQVLILMGSNSDFAVVEETVKMLKEFDIPFEVTIASAHRTPERVRKISCEAEGRGIEVIIAAAGAAAHLAGAVAAHTLLPVIGVPIDSSPLHGFDALLSTVQMPPGVPVAVMAVGSAGAKNAAIFAAQILARKDRSLFEKLLARRERITSEIEAKAEALKVP